MTIEITRQQRALPPVEGVTLTLDHEEWHDLQVVANALHFEDGTANNLVSTAARKTSRQSTFAVWKLLQRLREAV